ncbi:MAG: BT_3928 family protein [Paludibacter sp.]
MSQTNSRISNTIMHASRFLFGLVFVFSGFVKAVDPLGMTYKLQDYFTALGGMFYSLSDNALLLAITLSTIELFIGLNLVFAIQIRRTAFLGLLFMLVMTPLTLWIALKNPVSDCGCFGDALKISNWETFSKNIVLLALIIAVLFTTRPHQKFFILWVEWIAMVIFLSTGIGISTYAYNHLPQIDFLPYKKGVNIAEAIKIPENAPTDKYETTFIYEKDGTQKEFSLDNYPKDDSTWVFVDQKTTLVEEGYKPPIHDFTIYNQQYEDIAPDIIATEGYTYLVVMYELNKASIEGAQHVQKLFEKYENTNVRIYVLTASADEDIDAFVQKTKVTFPFYKSDPITLKTIIRANPGLVLIKNGTITGKWHWRDF